MGHKKACIEHYDFICINFWSQNNKDECKWWSFLTRVTQYIKRTHAVALTTAMGCTYITQKFMCLNLCTQHPIPNSS